MVSVQATAAAINPPQGLQNAITVSEYEAEAIKLANAAAAASSGYGSKSLHKRRRSNKHKQQQQTRGAATASAAANASASKAAALQANLEESSVDPYASAEARRKRCQLVAGRGRTVSTCPFAWSLPLVLKKHQIGQLTVSFGSI